MIPTRRPGQSSSSSSDLLSSTLESSASIGDKEIVVSGLLPRFSQTRFWIVIAPWTVNAELRIHEYVSGTTTLSWSSGTALEANHAAGTPVIFVEDNTINVDWFGAASGWGVAASQNTTGINRAFSQISKQGNGYPMIVKFGQGPYHVNGELIVPVGGTEIQDGWVVHTADLGSGKYGLKLNGDGCKVRNFSIECDNFSVSAPSPNALMDGILVPQRTILENVHVTKFNRGFRTQFPDHTRWYGCQGDDNLYTYYWGNDGGITGGDIYMGKCDSRSARRAAHGVQDGNGPQGFMAEGCSWTSSPYVWDFEGEGDAGGSLNTCHAEFIATAYAYWSADTGGRGGGNWSFKELSPYNLVQNLVNASGHQVYMVANDMQVSHNWKIMTCTGAGSTCEFRWNTFTCLNDLPAAFCDGGFTNEEGALNTRIILQSVNDYNYYGRGLSGEGTLAYVDSGSAVYTGDLVETYYRTSPSNQLQIRQYTTSGAAPAGVVFQNSTSNGNICAPVQTSGLARINIDGTGTVAAGKYVKPDASHAGCVVEATSFSDGPIVGFASAPYDTSSTANFGTRKDRSVLVKLMV